MTRTLSTLLVLTVGLGAARAQPGDAAATADALFDEAKALIARGAIAEACTKFEASLKIEAALGTRLNLADCYERLGRVASAWSMYRAVADAARVQRDPREQLASERAGRLGPRLPHLRITLTDPPAGITVTRAGAPIDPALLDTEVPVDPGPTTIVARAPGYEPVTRTVVLTEGQATVVTVPRLRATPVAITARPAPAPGSGWARRRWLGVGLGAGGLALVGGGLGFGASARAAWDEAFADGDCDRRTRRCNPEGQALADRARLHADLSTGLVAAGVVSLGVGVYLVVTTRGPERRRATVAVPTLSADGVGLAVLGEL